MDRKQFCMAEGLSVRNGAATGGQKEPGVTLGASIPFEEGVLLLGLKQRSYI